MDLIGAVARVNTVSMDYVVQWLSDNVVDALLSTQEMTRDGEAMWNASMATDASEPMEALEMGVLASGGIHAGGAEMGLLRRALITWMFTYLGSALMYLVVASIDYYVIFVWFQKRFVPDYKPNYPEMRREIRVSLLSLIVMTLFTTPLEVLFQLGYGKLYHDASQYGWLYFAVSPVLFLVFSDSLIYWIHRGLHHRSIYKYIHKLHHSFVHVTPYAAFAFHPIDGFLQGVPYQLFVLFFPLHSTLHLVTLAAVGLWTINIHDRVTLHIPLVNGAAHHNIHHTTFKSNYGQYLVCWDAMFGTHRHPSKGAEERSEEEVYGKKYL